MSLESKDFTVLTTKPQDEENQKSDKEILLDVV